MSQNHVTLRLFGHRINIEQISAGRNGTTVHWYNPHALLSAAIIAKLDAAASYLSWFLRGLFESYRDFNRRLRRVPQLDP